MSGVAGSRQGSRDSARPWRPAGVGTSPWRVVAKREIWAKLRDRTFLVATGFMLVLIVASIALPALIGSSKTTVGVVEDRGAAVVQEADRLGERFETERVSYNDVDRLLRAGDLDAALLPAESGFELVGKSSVDSDVRAVLEQALRQTQVERNAAALGVEMESLTAGSDLTERLLAPAPFSEPVTRMLTLAFALLFYITALSFGLQLAQSVVQEKESRIVEILAAAIPVRSLLAGKVVGNTVLGLGQILLFSATGLIGLRVSDRGEMLAALAKPTGWFAVFFLLGFVGLAGIFAVTGAMATRQEDLQSTTLPAQSLLFIPLFVVLTGNQTAIAVMSYVPITSSIAMPVRMLSGNVPAWQPLLAAGITLVAAVCLVLLAARLYERALLQTRRTLKYRDLLVAD